LLIENDEIIITSTQSESLLEGAYFIELEENNEGTVTTVQRTKLYIKEDTTRTYGDAAPE
jgi:hypothetical protein